MVEKKKSSLSNQLIRLVVLPLLVLVIVITAVQVHFYFQHTGQLREQYLNQQIDQIVPALSKALYDADIESVNLLGDTLFRNHRVKHLMISDQFSRVYLRTRDKNGEQNALDSSLLIISRPLSHNNSESQRLLMGNITIHFSDKEFLVFLSKDNLWLIAMTIIKLLIPLCAVILFLYLKVNRHVQQLISGLKNARPDKYTPQTLDKQAPREMHELVDAYNSLQENNHLHHIRQQDAHNKLIERTQEVAEGRESARLLTSMLQSSQKRYRALFHRNVDPLLIVEPYPVAGEDLYRIIDANYAAISLLGSPLEILTKQNFEDIFGIKPLEHGTFRLPENILAKQGVSQTSYIELHFNMVMYDTHRLYYVTLRDVADKIRAEKLEKEASELMNFRQNQMAIAEMATTIAHEINQPLAAIQNYATSAINFHQQGNNSPEKISISLEQLIKQADIASDIVKQARGQLGRNDYPQTPLELVKTVHNTIDLCQLRAEKSKVNISFSSTIAEAWIIANEVQVKQLLINLISNALEVLSETNNSAGNITLGLDFEDEHYVLYVEDNGPGITDISRVFTTHYTTKKNGLGMGLSICRSIAEMHHGSISANNMSQGGARFSLKVPVYEPNEKLIKITTSVN